MRRPAILLITALLATPLLAAGCGWSGGDDEDAEATTSTTGRSTGSTVVEMSIPEVAGPATTDADGQSGTGAGTVIMLKLHVDDIDDGQAFYQDVFGANLAYDLGEGVRVLTLPEGPGFILIADDPAEADDWNASFLVQVPELAAAQALAEEHGATSEQSFQGEAGGGQARSVDMLDPWGNQIEILERS